MAGIETITKRRYEGRLKQEYDAWGRLGKSKKRTFDQKVNDKTLLLHCMLCGILELWML